MQYISGIYAMQIYSDETMGADWHYYSLNWDNIDLRESTASIFGDFGIKKQYISIKKREYYVANQLRACLDLMESGNLSHLYGSMRKDYIANEELNDTLFSKVLLLKNLRNWQSIDELMQREYMMKWINYRDGAQNGQSLAG